MELLNHVSKRLKSRPEVQLPVDQLLAQFTDPSSPAAVVVCYHHFLDVMLEMKLSVFFFFLEFLTGLLALWLP